MKNNTILSFLFCLCSTFLLAQPTADFTVNVTEGCSPLEVTFTDSSLGTGLTYLWDFGDGNTSNEMNPTLIYTVEAEYTVCLTVTDDQGDDDEICMTDLITVYPIDETYLSFALCPGNSIIVGGTEYSETNPSGTEVLTGSSVNGCDSIIYVDLTFFPLSVYDLDLTLCDDDFVTIAGTIYNVVNPIGTEVIANGDMYGCDSIININLTFVPADEPFLLDAEIVDAGCVGASNGSICLDVICGLPPYDYSWSPTGETGMCLVDVPAGSYTVTVTDANGNSLEQFYLIENVDFPTSLEITVCEGDSYLICGTNYDTEGMYVVDCGTNMYGCDSIIYLDFLILETISTIAPPDVITCSGPNSSIFLDGFESEGDVYLWTTADGDLCGNASSPFVEVCTEGTYCLEVTSSYTSPEQGLIECMDVSCVTVTSSLSFIVSETFTDVTCNGGNDGGIQLDNITGGCEPYTFLWNTGATGDNIANLEAGTYFVTVTDCSGCSQVNAYSIDEPSALSLVADNIQCATPGQSDGAINLDSNIGGTCCYAFLWSNGSTSQDVDNLIEGTYSVTVTDVNNCTASASFDTNEDLIQSITQSTTVCLFDNIQLDVTAPDAVAYSWEPANLLNDPTITNPIGSIENIAQTFTVTVTNADGCEDSDLVVINAYPGLYVEGVVTNAGCGLDDGVIYVTSYCGTEPYTYNWGAGLPSSDIVTDLAPGTYSVTVEDALGETDEETFIVEDSGSFNISISVDSTACEGEQLTFMVDAPTGPGYTYLWSGPGGFTSTDIGFTLTMDISTEGCYTVEVTDQNACTGSLTHCVDVTTFTDVINSPVFSAFICGSGSHQFDVDAPSSTGISWSPATGLSCTDCYDPVATPSVTTEYTYEVQAANGCLITRNVMAYVDEQPVINVVGPLLVCAGDSFGGCVAVDVGPNDDIVSWVWSTPLGIVTDECLNIPDVSSANEGLYEVTVTFGGGCTASTDFTVGVETVAYAISDDVTICAGTSTILDVSDTDIVSVLWSPPVGLACETCFDTEAAPLETTTYTATITSSNGCIANGMVTITVDQNCVWPGDTDTNKVVNNFDLLNIGLAYDSLGPVRPNANLMWVGQMGPDWMQTASNGSNYKHIDTDGNGLIDANDTLAVSQNWGSVHNFTGTNETEFIPTYPPSSGADFTIPFYVQPDTLIEGEMISLPVILGESGNPAEDVYGIAFTLEYDTAVVVPGSVYMGFDQSWLGENNADLISIHRDFFDDNKVDIGMTRIDGTPMTDFGTLASLFITVEDDLLFGPGGNSGFTTTQDEAIFNITNVLVINHLGEEIEVIPTQTNAPVVVTSTSTHNPDLADYISIFPSPVTDLLWVNTKNIKLSKIELLNLNGQMLSEVVAPDSQQKMNLSQLSVGTYFVKVYSEEGVYVERIVLIK